MEKKLYVEPQSKMVELDSEAIIAQSDSAVKLQNYEGEEWEDE